MPFNNIYRLNNLDSQASPNRLGNLPQRTVPCVQWQPPTRTALDVWRRISMPSYCGSHVDLDRVYSDTRRDWPISAFDPFEKRGPARIILCWNAQLAGTLCPPADALLGSVRTVTYSTEEAGPSQFKELVCSSPKQCAIYKWKTFQTQ